MVASLRIRRSTFAIDSHMEDDPAYDIVVTRVSGATPGCEARLREAVESTLRRHGTLTAQVSVAVVDDAHIARLNKRHLNHEGATDVLAFDLREDERTAGFNPCPATADPCRLRPAADLHVDGEIIVSADTAERVARERGHGLEAELALYAVHGALHLLGYDDHTQQAAARMHELEDEILSAIGVGAVFRVNPK